jgi:hypothetical protein
MRKFSRFAFSLKVALPAFFLLATTPPAAAKIVEFTATLKVGIGDGGNASTPSNQPNGLPICNKGLITHLNASVPAHGFVEVANGAAPQSIMDVRPYKYGTAGATGPTPTVSKPGVAGVNGAAKYLDSTCAAAIPASVLAPNLNARTQSSNFSWPANNTVFANPSAMTPSGGTVTRLSVGTALAAHTLAAGAGPGNFNVPVDAPNTQFISGMAGANSFGGGFRASGGGRVYLNVDLAPGQTATGYWLSGPRLLGHGESVATQVVTRSGTFTTNLASAMLLVEVRAWNLPWTTGMVHVEDHGGSFTTIRDTAGYDSRTSMGELGTLLLVSPWAANIPDLNLYFGGTGSLKFQFLPEPGPSALFAFGILGVLVLHVSSRRRADRSRPRGAIKR